MTLASSLAHLLTHLLTHSLAVCNVVQLKDIYETIQIPDKTANDIIKSGVYYRDDIPSHDKFIPIFSMAAGDFVELYSQEKHRSMWNAVVTCFFMDTVTYSPTYLLTYSLTHFTYLPT